jgi:hypothetical protein
MEQNLLLRTFPNEKKLHTVTTRRPLAITGQTEVSKHNLEKPAKTEFTNLHCLTAGKQRVPSYLYSHQWWSAFLIKGGKGTHVVHGMMG